MNKGLLAVVLIVVIVISAVSVFRLPYRPNPSMRPPELQAWGRIAVTEGELVVQRIILTNRDEKTFAKPAHIKAGKVLRLSL